MSSLRKPQHSVPNFVSSARFAEGLRLLREARGYAEALGRNLWDFAVEIAALYRTGLSSSDLRWLACREFVAHAIETTRPGKQGRVYRRPGLLSFTTRSCFVLTEAGQVATAGAELGQPHHAAMTTSAVVPAPRWDAARRELRVGNAVVKHFRVPADNQELILAAFEEEGWPVQLDDPLPPRPLLDAKRRLVEAIKRLNHHQMLPLLHFEGNGHGNGLVWSLIG
jgi:hypothetical protein